MNQPDNPNPQKRLPTVVKATGVVSFFTDMGSEIIYPILPLFLTGMGATRTTIGLIEGLAEGFPAFIKLFSGALSDRIRNRKWLVLTGYALSTLFKPLIALAGSPAVVLALRMLDRLGKGIRSAPRDALVADSTDPSMRGYAFGYQRAMDHAGALTGGLIAFALLSLLGLTVKQAIAFSILPGLLSVLTIVLFVKDRSDRKPAPARTVNPLRNISSLPRTCILYMFGAGMFAMANSSDAFLLLRAKDMGVGVALIPLLWSMLHLVKSTTSVWGGRFSDRFGRMPVLLAGWFLYSLVYVGFALTHTATAAWLLFAAYGLFFGLTEGASRAVIADQVPEGLRGTAFGLWGLIEGLLLIAASLLTGWLWDRTGNAAIPMLLCSALSLAATLYLGILWKCGAIQSKQQARP